MDGRHCVTHCMVRRLTEDNVERYSYTDDKTKFIKYITSWPAQVRHHGLANHRSGHNMRPRTGSPFSRGDCYVNKSDLRYCALFTRRSLLTIVAYCLVLFIIKLLLVR